MKVAFNGCFGGFSLSPLAETEYRKKKGITLTWYEGVGDYPYESYVKVADVSALSERGRSIFSLSAAIEDLGDRITKIPEGSAFYESWYGSENRSDPDLIAVIESLGDASSGVHANLMIKEIPDGAEFEIDEYDGNETVVPPRQVW
jgi:hypothetical protein